MESGILDAQVDISEGGGLQISHKNKEIVLFWSAWDEVFGLQLMTAPRFALKFVVWREEYDYCSLVVPPIQGFVVLDSLTFFSITTITTI